MNWKEKVFKGMQLIKEGCAENTMWTECNECPFTDFCDTFNLPSNWFEEEEEEK